MPEANHGIRSKITKKLFINLLCTAVLTRFASSAVAVIDGLLTSRWRSFGSSGKHIPCAGESAP